MKKTDKTIVLNCDRVERRLALLHNGRLEEYQIERDDDTPKVGDIFLGRIVNLDLLLQAAFVDIGAPKNAFLHFSEMLSGCSGLDDKNHSTETGICSKRRKSDDKNSLSKNSAESRRRKDDINLENIPKIFRPGMEILVQVIKAPISTKGARVTTDISIPGRYLVLMPYNEHIGLSNRIESTTERERLKKILSQQELPEGMGMICRTAGEGRKSAFFKNDLHLLLDYWENISKDMERFTAPRLLYTEPNLVERTIRDFMTDEINGGIVVDNKEAKAKIVETLKRCGAKKLASKVTFYDKSTPIFDAWHINEQLKSVFQREVKLAGGGAIVIDETEALIAIDVNSGRGKNGQDQPEFILKTNLEAAEEIARQLRLRNVGGLVVIDFIDMKSQSDRDEVMRHMKKLVKDDKAKTKLLPISKMGLMEMTRQREQESILDQVYTPCPYCNGSGLVKSAVTVSAEIQRSLAAVLRDKKYKNVPVRVIMHPDVLAKLRNEDEKFFSELEKKYHHELSFRADPELHHEEFRLVDPDTGAELN